MKRMLSMIVIVSVLWCGALIAQVPASLEGKWTLDVAKSFPTRADGGQHTLVVRQTPQQLELVREGTLGKTVVTHHLDAAESTNVVAGTTTRTRASWQGTRLIITGTRQMANGREANLSQVLRLSGDRQELVIDEVLTSDLVTYKATRVYRRQ
jgi:hypothetical protein